MKNNRIVNSDRSEDYSISDLNKPFDLEKIKALLGIPRKTTAQHASLLPFTEGDITAGTENELQTVVTGNNNDVDLALVIKDSNYFKNILKRAVSGDTSPKALSALEQFLEENTANVWENSWVRFPRSVLSQFGKNVFERDLLSDKSDWTGPKRKDVHRFCFYKSGEPFIRIPVSYLLKIALADAVGMPDVHPLVRSIGESFMGHFLNDNTSPETYSFYPAMLTAKINMGRSVARETLLRYLLCQFLTEYANRKFLLSDSGQKAMVYFAPHPPVRQKRLNELVSDCFYRYLFMSPCLSGWDRGEDKHEYMQLCHQVLSRSQLNAVAKLKEAGIITNNLVVLPNMSNICLANNGTHISLGSRKFTELLKHRGSGFTQYDEKYMGDLVIKIVEHFLPLFVGTYSAAPYRLSFTDFHPEKALGFLPHELDYTHLRMIWRRWKKKAHLKFCGHPITPFGPELLDKLIAKTFGLKGDFVTDYRLIDYLASLLSTDQSPGLDGNLDNDLRLKDDLASMGIFDMHMPVYLLYRIRQFSVMGFSGFEGRHYSLFESVQSDMEHAVNLQVLVTALAYKYIFQDRFKHKDIPDTPSIESERRQVFFGSAIGIPTFFVKKNTPNRFMADILKNTSNTRLSRRYQGYLRVYNQEYRLALVRILKKDAADLIELMQLSDTMQDLEIRLNHSATQSTGGKLTKGILDQVGEKNAINIEANEFNVIAEKYYRTCLKKKHTSEAFALMENILHRNLYETSAGKEYFYHTLKTLFPGADFYGFLKNARNNFLTENLSHEELIKLIHLILLIIHYQKQKETC